MAESQVDAAPLLRLWGIDQGGRDLSERRERDMPIVLTQRPGTDALGRLTTNKQRRQDGMNNFQKDDVVLVGDDAFHRSVGARYSEPNIAGKTATVRLGPDCEGDYEVRASDTGDIAYVSSECMTLIGGPSMEFETGDLVFVDTNSRFLAEGFGIDQKTAGSLGQNFTIERVKDDGEVWLVNGGVCSNPAEALTLVHREGYVDRREPKAEVVALPLFHVGDTVRVKEEWVGAGVRGGEEGEVVQVQDAYDILVQFPGEGGSSRRRWFVPQELEFVMADWERELLATEDMPTEDHGGESAVNGWGYVGEKLEVSAFDAAILPEYDEFDTPAIEFGDNGAAAELRTVLREENFEVSSAHCGGLVIVGSSGAAFEVFVERIAGAVDA